MKNSPFSIKTHKWLKTLIKTLSPSNPTSTINSYLSISGMCRKLGPNCGYPQFRVIFAQKLGWCWVVGVNLWKLGLNNPNLPPILPPNCGKIVVKLVLWLGLGVVLHILIGLGLWLGVAHPWFTPSKVKGNSQLCLKQLSNCLPSVMSIPI